MKYCTSTPNRSSVRIFIVSLLAYVLLTSQLAPLAVAAKAKLNRAAERRAPISIPDESSGAAQPISSETQFAPVPKPLPPTVPAMAPLAVNIVATKTDNRTVAQPAAPGDTINYTVVIQNLGSTDATNVTFTDTIDANTTLVPNSIVSTPLANNDTYNVVGNVRIQPNAAQGLLTNDFNPDTGNGTGITASGPVTSTQGGNVTVNADGSFSYNPAAGFAGTDTFTYTLTVTATAKTDTATVTLNVGNGTATPGTNVVWFINPAAAAGGDGRLTTPFNCYTGAGCFSTVAADEVGDTIFLFSGAHLGGNTLLNNQKLIGQGASATLASIAGLTVPTGSDALPATGGASPTITTVIAATVGVPLGQGNTLRGFTVGNVTGTKISGNTFGTLIVGNNTTPDVILNGTGRALGLTTGTFAATSGFASVTTTSSTAQGIQLTGVAGTVSFGSTSVSGATSQGIFIGTTTADINFGNTTVSGGTDGVSFQNNSAGTRTFGTLGVSGGSGNAFIHGAGGGNVTISGAAALSSAGDAISVSAPGATNVINFQAATSATRTAAGGNGVNWAGTAGATMIFSALTIQTNAGSGLNATLGGTINVTNGTGTINNTTQAAPAIVANSIALNANFSAINSSGGTNGVSLTNVTGISNFGGGALSGTTGGTFNVSGGTASVTYSGSITQANNAAMVFIGGGHTTGTITFQTGTLSATNGTGLQFDNADGIYNFNGTTTLNGGDAGIDILNGSNGNFTFSSGTSITNPSGTSFNINGGTGNVTYNGTITDDVGLMVSVANTTGGTKSFTGAITDNNDGDGTEQGVSLTSNTGATISFSGGLAIRTTTNAAFTATGGGTVNVCDENPCVPASTGALVNTLTSTTGTALNVANTNIGLNNLEFRSINAGTAASGPTNGIILNTTGTTASFGGLKVKGTGAAGTGGTIQRTTGAGMILTSTRDVSLVTVIIQNGGDDGITGSNVTNFTLTNSTISTNGNAVQERGLDILNLLGTSSITGSTITGNAEDNLFVQNGTGTLNLTTTATTYANNSAAIGNDGIHFLAAAVSGLNNANMSITVTNCIFTNHRGDHFQATTDAATTGTQTVVFQNNDLNNVVGTNLGAGLTLNPSGSATVNFNISNNGTVADPFSGAFSSPITINSSNNATMSGTINNNVIGNPAVTDSGSFSGNGIDIVVNGKSDITVAITNNLIREYSNLSGIRVAARDDVAAGAGGTINATITGNTISDPGTFAGEGLFVSAGAVAGDDHFICADIGGAGALANSIAGSGANGSTDFRVRQRFLTTVRLPGYAGANNNDAAVVAFIQGRNNGAETGSADNNVAGGGGGFVGGAACTAPALAPNPIDEMLSLGAVTSDIPNRAPVAQPAAAENPAPVLKTETPKLATAGQMDMPKFAAAGGMNMPKAKLEESKFRDKDGGTQKPIKPKEITPNLANFPLTIGTLAAGKSVTVTFSVTVNNPLPGGVTQVSNQGTVSGNDGATPFNILTDDPDVAGTNNPTVTGITAPPDINIKDAKVGEPPTGTTSMLFTVMLSAAATGPVSVNFATANGGATPATGGTCAGGADYETTNGTVNFIAGQQIQTIAIPVCSDATVEGDETFLVNLSTPTNGIIVDGQATGTITPNTPGVTLISELRTSGPGGSNDDFVEIYNNSDSPLMVAASDASAGYGLFKMGAACGDTPVLLGTIPNGTVIPARGHYLLVGSAYSLADYGGTGAAAGNVTMTSDIESDRNVALFNTSNILNISSTTRLDAVGFGANTGNNCDLLREGTNLGAVLGSTLQYSFVRKLETGRPQDTNNNVEDLVFVDTAATLVAGAGQRLGAPGPENLSNPLQRNATIKASLVDPGVASTSPPNRVRDLTPDPANNSTLGTLDIRRKFTNNTGGLVTRLRFRIVDITTAPPPGGTADLRARTSTTVSGVMVSGGGTVTIEGLTLEQPPTQSIGGGYNSTLSAGTITLATPLAPGASTNFRFLLGVQQNGSFRFFINVEALP
ncbi:MAG TPA: Ig-like domain-containing protein [Pyrinomonadaceae bacterium]|nr:Ig-like domain-containing protein [Pyrinomonadaceae bacterium]